MSDYSRRDFLLHSTTAALALSAPGLAAAAQAPASQGPTNMTIATWSGTKELSASELQQAAVKLTEKAIEGLGGHEAVRRAGGVVWVKPNIGWDRTPEQAANTNPGRRGHDHPAVLRRRREDGQGRRQPLRPGRRRPTTPAASPRRPRPWAPRCCSSTQTRFKETDDQGRAGQDASPSIPAIIECDLVINIPIVKHHALATLDAVHEELHGRDREAQRSSTRTSPTCLADITRFMKPRLCILDAMRILKAHGPKGGNLDDVETQAHRGRRHGHRRPGRLGRGADGQEARGHRLDRQGRRRPAWARSTTASLACGRSRFHERAADRLWTAVRTRRAVQVVFLLVFFGLVAGRSAPRPGEEPSRAAASCSSGRPAGAAGHVAVGPRGAAGALLALGARSALTLRSGPRLLRLDLPAGHAPRRRRPRASRWSAQTASGATTGRRWQRAKYYLLVALSGDGGASAGTGSASSIRWCCSTAPRPRPCCPARNGPSRKARPPSTEADPRRRPVHADRGHRAGLRLPARPRVRRAAARRFWAAG